MIKRALLIGTILAGLTGVGVYYGLDENAALQDAPVSEVSIPEISVSVKPNGDGNSEALSEIAPHTGVGGSRAEDTPPAATLKAVLDMAEKNVAQSEMPKEDDTRAYGSWTGNDTPEIASETVKDLMTRQATGRFIVEDEVEDNNQKDVLEDTEFEPDMASDDMIEIETLATKAPEYDIVDLTTDIKTARRITHKTTRDKIYLEIFENAIASGHMDMARRLSEKLSTPDLRKFAREIIASADGQAQ